MRHCARKRIIRIFIATTMTALVVASFGVMPAARAAMVPNSFTDDGTMNPNGGSATGGGFGNGTNSQTEVSGSGTGADIRLSTISFQPKSDAELSESATVPLGSAPYAIAFDPFTNSIWVAQQGGGGSKIDLSTNAVTAVSGVGSSFGVAFDSFTNSVWMTNYFENLVYKINPVTLAVTSLWMAGPRGIAFDSFTNSIWVARTDGFVSKIDPVANAVTATVSMPGLPSFPRGIAFDSFTNSIWVVQGDGNVSKITNLSSANPTVTATIPGLYLYAIAFDPFTNSVWVASSSRGYKINPVTAVTDTINGASSYSPIAFDSFTNSIWVAQEFVGAKKINPVTAVAAATVPLSSYIQPFSSPVAFDSFTKSIWVGIGSPAAIIKIDLTKPYYASSGVFTSAAINLGAPSSFTTLSFNAMTTNAQTSCTQTTGVGCAMKIQMAANNDNATWNYVGPDGTASTYFTVSGEAIPSSLNNSRYVRYKAYLQTNNSAYTPTLNDITINYQNSANYDFLLSSSFPANIETGDAPSKISTITVAVQNPQDASINDAVNFSATVSPSGPVISFSPVASCVPSSGTCAVDVYASAVTAGNYTVTVRGSNASAAYSFGIARTVDIAFTVSLSNFLLSDLSLQSGEVIRGYEATSYVANPPANGPPSLVQTVLTVNYISGADEFVSISYDILPTAPSGISVQLSPFPGCRPQGGCAPIIQISADSSVGIGDYTITFKGTSDISNKVKISPTPFTLRVRDPINYSLSGNSGAAFQGSSVSSTITGTHGGYPAGTENVTFASFSSASNPSAFFTLPSVGTISVSFTPGTCTLGENQPSSCAKSVTISTSSNTTVGDYVITLTGVSSITNTARTMAYTFTVSGPFDFTMAYPSPPCATASTCSGTVEQASSMNVTVNVASLSAAGENVAFSITGLPANTAYSVSLAPNPCVPTASVPCTATLTISPAITASLGTYAVNIVGTSTKRAHLLPFTLTIAQGFTFDVALSASSGVAVRGGSAESAVASISLFSGTGKPVTLSVDGLTGSGVVAGYPGGQSCTPNCQQQITFTAPSSAVLGTYNLLIIGTAGTQTKQAAYTLTVVDPFDFSLSLSSTQGSILAGGNIQTVATLDWRAGGSGADTVSLSPSVPALSSGTLTVDFNPTAVVGLSSSVPSAPAVITMTASGDLTSNSYSVVIIAQSGTLIKTKTYNLTVGTTLDFTLSLVPDNERVLQGASSAPIAITAQNTSPENQPASSDIAFSIGDTPTYLLPRGVTTTPATLASCALGATIGSVCSSPIVFNVDATGVNGTYLIPIVGTSGFVSRIVYYTLKVGPLNLINYQSPDLMTDAHQRPQASFTWSPPAVFAGDTVQFDAAPSTVYDGEPNLLASTPVSNANADFSWSFAGITRCSVNADCSTGETCLNGTCYLPGSTLINPQVFYQNSGMRDITLTVTDIAEGCYTSTTSSGEEEPCACTVSSAASSPGAPQLEVSKPRPAFREITPQ